MRPHDNRAPAESPQVITKIHPERCQMDDLQLAIMKVIVPMATIFGWITNALPSIAAAVSIAWMLFQWYHSAPMVARREKRKELK